MRLDGYIRVSRVGGRDGEGYISPDIQREAITGYASELGGRVVAWHDDQDFSGGSIERPGFQECLDRLRAGKSDGIVVMKIDRFARSVADGASTVRDIVERGQVFASCHERIDPRTPEGKFMLTSFLANAELFLDQSRAAWNTAKTRAVARGVHIGPKPIGYAAEKSMPLTAHPFYGPGMTELFRRSAEGEGDSALARWFSEAYPGEDRTVWHPSEIRRWLRNRVYLGEVRYGDLVNPDAHPALTDEKTWQAAQKVPGVHRKPHSKFLLSGLVRCAHCRYSMGGFTYGGTSDNPTPVYRCGKARNGGCDAASVITAANLEAYVKALVREAIDLRMAESSDVDLEALDTSAEQATEERRAFAADLGARRTLGDEAWREALTARVEAENAALSVRDEGYRETRLAGLVGGIDELSDVQLRGLLDGLVRVIFVRRRPRGAKVNERALVVWSDDPSAIDLPGPHRSGPFSPYEW